MIEVIEGNRVRAIVAIGEFWSHENGMSFLNLDNGKNYIKYGNTGEYF